MNCRKMKECIYVYNELTASERKIVDEHLGQCEACHKLAHQLFQSQEVIKRAALHNPELRNPHVLTQRIMNAIGNEKGRSTLLILNDFMDGIVVRYAIGVVSVILISFFIYEQQVADYSSSGNRAIKSEISKGAVLDYGKFMNSYVKQRENKQSDIPNSRYSFYKSERVEKKL